MRELGDRRRFNSDADCFAACEKAHIACLAAYWMAPASSSVIPGRGVPPSIARGVENSFSYFSSSSRRRPPVVAFMVSAVVILYRSFVGVAW